MLGRGPRKVFARLAAALLGAALVSGCASDLLFANGRYLQRKQGFSFAAPTPDQPPWKPTRVEHTLAAWTRPGGARLAVLSECGRNPPSPQVLARSLWIGVEATVLRQSGPVAVGAFHGWSQIVDVGQDPARALHMKAVTLVAEECTVDFVLLARDDFASLEPDFDRWWQSFERPVAPSGTGS